jgi:beta-glucosidase
VRRLLTIRFRLGMFDPPAMVKYARIPYSVNDSPAHRNWRSKPRANRSCF